MCARQNKAVSSSQRSPNFQFIKKQYFVHYINIKKWVKHILKRVLITDFYNILGVIAYSMKYVMNKNHNLLKTL
jgi:hypothetical protein